MNRDKRKVVANIFADAAKYVLTAGVLGSVISERVSPALSLLLLSLFIVLTTIAYLVMPADKEE